MRIFVGTSGWYYDWNPEKNLDWYLLHSGLNSVELNASFYRFPFPGQVKKWALQGSGLKWAVKVHRLITHQHRFSPEAFPVWQNFLSRFRPLDRFVAFYLFQTPPDFQAPEVFVQFVEKTDLGGRAALELRNLSLLQDERVCARLREKFTLVSIDSPDIQEKIFPGECVYLRMHGRSSWYNHDYGETELARLADKLLQTKARDIFVFFNNNHAMLKNAQMMYSLLTGRKI
ncbi:MAG TPA: DUF72 domain-containing protein [bacterium]|nr:DUF72 domain-containing protein [bacterium]HOL65928.1 DUF72 domain-containing protein [bacterium]